jgi:hypothetical protein
VDLTALTIKPAVAVSSSEKLGEKRQKFPLNRSFAPHGDLVPFNARFADGSKTPFGRATSRPSLSRWSQTPRKTCIAD